MMNPARPGVLPAFAQTLRRRVSTARRAREESRFQPHLRFDPDAPALVLSPHLDDAVLDCWSLLSSDRELTVVNLFAGVPAAGHRGVWEAVLGVSDSAERTRMRIAEDARALACAGRQALNLGLLDAQYREAPAALGLADLDGALAAAAPSASRVYAPAGIGAHGDHLLARRYARMLLAAGMPVTLYAELPYCIFHGWPAWVDGREPEPSRDVDAYWLSFLERVPEMPALRSATVERLQPALASAKLEAIRCYRTSLNDGVIRLLSEPEIHRYEVHWELLEQARGNVTLSP
jgi:LmbE family N-acetylglucosaminyl deacetylase